MNGFLKILLFVMATLMVFSGCTKRTMPTEEAVKMTTRTYPIHTPDTILQAVSDLFFLSDVSAFQVTQTSDQLVARRTYGLDIGLTFVQATDTWKIEVKKTSEGTVVALDVKSEETWISGKTEVQTPNGPAVYQQFWQRLDYLVSQSSTWMTCQDLINKYLEDRTWGDTWWLCSEVADRVPPELIGGTWKNAGGLALSLEDHNACSRHALEDEYGKAQTERQHEVYRSMCLEEMGYEKIQEFSDIQP